MIIFPLSEHCCEIRRLWIACRKIKNKTLFCCSPVGLNPNLGFIMKAQCLYTHPHLMRRVSSLIAEYEEIFHVLSLIGKRHSCLSVVFLTHSLGYDLEIGHHVFPPQARCFILLCYVILTCCHKMETTPSFHITPYLYYKVHLVHLNSSHSPSLLFPDLHPSPTCTPEEGISWLCDGPCPSS